MTTNKITQDDLDALWLAARVSIPIGDIPRELRGRAQLRVQRLISAGYATQPWGKGPQLVETKE